ncbi:hypothetical protein ACLKA7_011726 [Drosophila subpalustris]
MRELYQRPRVWTTVHPTATTLTLRHHQQQLHHNIIIIIFMLALAVSVARILSSLCRHYHAVRAPSIHNLHAMIELELNSIPSFPQKTPCKPTCGCQQNGDSSCSSSSYSSVSSYDNIAYAAEKSQDQDSSPADPISVSLAAQAGKAINVPEAKLAYGFAQKPVDGQQKVFFSNVPEENLFKLKSEVITLKKRNYSAKEEEEEYVEEEEQEASNNDDAEVPQLTYKQLGYITEQYKNPKFKKVTKKSSYSSDSYGSSSSSDSYAKVGDKVSVDCGFKPGRVTSYRNARRQELMSDAY